MSETWVTFAQVLKLTGRSRRWALLQSAGGKIVSRASSSVSGNGKPQREYLLSSLPPAAQIKFAEQTAATPTAAIVPYDSLPLFAAAPAPPCAPSRPALPPDLDRQAEARFRAIEPLLDFKNQLSRGATIRTEGGKTIRNLDELAAYVAAQQQPPVSTRTIWRWFSQFKRKGYAALADATRKDRGRSRFFVEHAEAAAFAQHKFLKEGISNARMVHEAVCREWPRLSHEGTPPSYPTVRSYLDSLPKPLTTLAREGGEAYVSKCSPYVLRGKIAVMDWWIADHRVHDVLVRNTLFDQLKDDQAFRPWLTAVYDWGSRKLVGFCFAPTPSSRTINSALRMALSAHGFPRNFYWDNGKDFKKVRTDLERVELSDGLARTLKREGVPFFDVTSALPKHPRSKPIEAYFTRWSRRFDVMWEPAYLGNRPGNCPAAARQAQKQHDEYLAGKREKSPLPTDAEFIFAAVQWIEEYNATAFEQLDGLTPNKVYTEAFPSGSRAPVSRRALDVLLGDQVTRTVLAGGCVEIARMRYEPTDEALGPMSMRQARKIVILRDPYNLAEAVAADPDTYEFIGELRLQQFVEQCPNGRITQDQIQAQMRKQRALKRAYSDWLGLLGAVASARGWKTERHALMERAGLRTGTDDRPALPEGAAPGARQPRQLAPAPRIKPGSTFISDAVAEDAALWAEVEQS